MSETHFLVDMSRLDAAGRAAHRRLLLRDFQHKAQEYLEALCLEVGLALDQDEAKALQLALRQDFIEVHNAALKDPIAVPESANEIDRLLE